MRTFLVSIALGMLVAVGALAAQPPWALCHQACAAAHKACQKGCPKGDAACHQACAAEAKACRLACRGGLP